MTVSMTAFGIVCPGQLLPPGVPQNFGLKQTATNEFQMGCVPGGRGNMKGESSYRSYYDDLEDNKTEWLAFFDHEQNYVHADSTRVASWVL